jgi:hypothetical protein
MQFAALCLGGHVKVDTRLGDDGHLGAVLGPGRWLLPLVPPANAPCR